VSEWTNEELDLIGRAEELQVAFRRRDESLSSARIIWVVRHGDDLYVRSVNGPGSAWYRGTRIRQEGHIQAGGVSRDVAFADADHGLDDELDGDYQAKYHRYAASIIDRINSPQARATTIRLMPR
jgi:hypothetical protein